MAIVQISQIQIRRGLQQDLPQLASAEMGWSIDKRRLFIGNGSTDEGAPQEGVTEILTESTNILSLLNTYTFAGTDSGYTSQTGAGALTPVTRSFQSVLDEQISVKDFGATGNGTTDDTAAITRAISQIYVSSLNNSHNFGVQRTIKFPAGTYKITSTIVIPPNVTLTGDGKNNSIISATTGTAFSTCDSLFQTGGSIGANSAVTAKYITVSDLGFVTLAGTVSVMIVDSATDVAFTRVAFTAPTAATSVVGLASTVSTPASIDFDTCSFTGGVIGLTSTGYASVVRVRNSKFVNCSSYGINITSLMSGVVSENNYFTNVGQSIYGMVANNYSYGDTINGASTHGGIYSGSAKYGVGFNQSLSSGTTVLRTLSNGAGTIDYQLLDSNSASRFGTLKYNVSSGVCSFDDEWTEPTVSLGANIYANASGYLTATVSNTTTIRYNIKQFIL